MKLTACRILICILFSSLLSSCGTVFSMVENDYSIYAGVSRDLIVIQDGGILSVLAVIDLPLSFVLDTLMLPVTLSQ